MEQNASGEMLLWYEIGNCFIVRALDERRILMHARLRSVKGLMGARRERAHVGAPLREDADPQADRFGSSPTL